MGREGENRAAARVSCQHARTIVHVRKQVEVTVSSLFQTLRRLERFASGTRWQKNSPCGWSGNNSYKEASHGSLNEYGNVEPPRI